jgi:hypothetical protein
MKKLITLVLALVCVLGLVGCNQKAVSASEVYSFPEPTTMITVSFYSQGEETAFEIGSEEYDSNDLSTTPVINWFYDLKLTACDEPEAVEGSESYTLDFVLHCLLGGLAEMHTDDIGGLANLLSDSRASGGVGCGIVHSKSSCK